MRHDTVACDMTLTIPPLLDTLPADPLPLVAEWLAEAAKSVRNSTAMTLATVGTDGRPAARMVICRGFDARAGAFVFYTDRESDKGSELAARPWAALVFHWDVVERQIRVAGPVSDVSDAESDRYWAARPFEARAAAAASDQSRPLGSRAVLLARIADVTSRADGGEIARPKRWGGYRVWAERVELWVGQPGRAHDRARWVRTLTRSADGFAGGAWSGTRLMP
jgi:pyridoxamine 5'-phosphate oxidase